MTTLNIQLDSLYPETVSSAIIDQLYRLAVTSKVEDLESGFTMTLKGSLQSIAAYEDAVTYLLAKFPNLTITIPNNNYYIRFSDNNVFTTLLNNGVGDGVGISINNAREQTSLPSFANNTSILSFNELSRFINVKSSPSFYGCSNLKNVDLSNITTIGESFFLSCGITTLNAPNLVSIGRKAFRYSGLEEVINMGNIVRPDESNSTSYNEGSTFNACYNLITVNLPASIIRIATAMFYDCKLLQNINFPSSITSIGNAAFYNCQSLHKVGNFVNVTQIYNGVFSGESSSTACGMRHVYLPKLQHTYPGCKAGSDRRNSVGFIWYHNWERVALFDILYFKNILTFGSCTFSGGTIRNLIINNTTPPTIVGPTNGQVSITENNFTVTRTADLTNYPTLATDIFFGVTSILNIYVPDSAYTTYTGMTWDSTNKVGTGTANPAAGYESVVNKIKPLSEINLVATEALWQELTDNEKLDTLITEYMT